VIARVGPWSRRSGDCALLSLFSVSLVFSLQKSHIEMDSGFRQAQDMLAP
jgi:hypothetical protein